MHEVYTLPQPFIPDIAILHDLGNVSYKMAANCGELCRNASHFSLLPDQDIQTWQTVLQDVSLVTFPVVASCGIIAGLASVAVLSMKRRHNDHCFLIAYTTSCVLLLVCGAILKLEDHTGHCNTLQYANGCLKAAHSWFACSALWILVVSMVQHHPVAETQSVPRNGPKYRQYQEGIASLVIYCVNFISCVPQRWAYETVEVYDHTTDKTIAISRVSEAANTPAYSTVYFWYIVAITVIAPYPIMLGKLVLITLKRSRKLPNTWPLKRGPGIGLHCVITEAIHENKYLLVTTVTYMALVGPLVIMDIIDNLNPLSDNQSYVVLHSIAELMFYVHFTLPFPLLWRYNTTFRRSLNKLTKRYCRCKRCQEQPKMQTRYGPPKNQHIVTFLEA